LRAGEVVVEDRLGGAGARQIRAKPLLSKSLGSLGGRYHKEGKARASDQAIRQAGKRASK
jgi:hypothetical protein